MNLFTIGYEKRELPEFIETLQNHGVAVVADIRANPNSRKKGFSKKALELELARNGIEYRHFVELGAPNDLRDMIRAGGNYADFFVAYNRYLISQVPALTQLGELALSKPVCLLCYERNVDQCHRKAVAESLMKLQPGKFGLIHIE